MIGNYMDLLKHGKHRCEASQAEYLRKLGCPFPPEKLDSYVANRVIKQLIEDAPDRADESLATSAEDEADWRNGPASEAQLARLRSFHIRIEPNMTKGRATQLLSGSEPSEGQLRRLHFYGINRPVTAAEAHELIEAHMQKHPESEDAYQESKIGTTPLPKKVATGSWLRRIIHWYFG